MREILIVLCTSIFVHISVPAEIWESGRRVEDDEVAPQHRDSAGIFETTHQVQIHVPACSRLTYAKLVMDHSESCSKVVFDNPVNVLIISDGLLQNSWFSNDVVVQEIKDNDEETETERQEEKEIERKGIEQYVRGETRRNERKEEMKKDKEEKKGQGKRKEKRIKAIKKIEMEEIQRFTKDKISNTPYHHCEIYGCCYSPEYVYYWPFSRVMENISSNEILSHTRDVREQFQELARNGYMGSFYN